MNPYVYFFEDGRLKYTHSNGRIQTCEKAPQLDEEWEFIPEPVDFMTAVNSGKKIKPEGNVNAFDWLAYWRGYLTTSLINSKWEIEE